MLRARTLASPGGFGEGVVGPFCDRAACPDNAASRWYSHFQENTTAAGEGSRLPLPRIDPWRDQLEGLLLENQGKPVRERLTLIFEELRALGYEGSYDAVRRCLGAD
jgi:hypothetical protein